MDKTTSWYNVIQRQYYEPLPSFLAPSELVSSGVPTDQDDRIIPNSLENRNDTTPIPRQKKVW